MAFASGWIQGNPFTDREIVADFEHRIKVLKMELEIYNYPICEVTVRSAFGERSIGSYDCDQTELLEEVRRAVQKYYQKWIDLLEKGLTDFKASKGKSI